MRYFPLTRLRSRRTARGKIPFRPTTPHTRPPRPLLPCQLPYHLLPVFAIAHVFLLRSRRSRCFRPTLIMCAKFTLCQFPPPAGFPHSPHCPCARFQNGPSSVSKRNSPLDIRACRCCSMRPKAVTTHPPLVCMLRLRAKGIWIPYYCPIARNFLYPQD